MNPVLSPWIHVGEMTLNLSETVPKFTVVSRVANMHNQTAKTRLIDSLTSFLRVGPFASPIKL